MKKYVKIEVEGASNKFNEAHPNSCIFLNYGEYGDDTAILIIVDNEYTRRSAERYFKSVKYLREVKIFEKDYK